MPYLKTGNFVTFHYRDERNDLRNRTVELGGLVVVTDDDAEEWSAVSKSCVRGYSYRNDQVDQSKVADPGSEVKDTLRLYFLMEDDSRGHLDIVDPQDSLFIAPTGAGANILKTRDELVAGGPGSPGAYLDIIIAKCLGGQILISDGETPVTFLEGVRL